MLALEPAWADVDRTWVTLSGADVDYLLRNERVVLGNGPTNRSIANLIRNIALAWRVITEHQPDVIVSTGAGLAVPFFLIGRLRRRRLVYVESVTRIETISLSGRLVYPLADRFFVQWPEAARSRRRATYQGSVL
jgi:beta-1,4-N-acetylglucosaminyltransferase